MSKHRHRADFVAAFLIIVLGGISIAFFVYAYPNAFETQVSFLNGEELKAGDPVIVSFSYPMVPNFIEPQIEIAPEIKTVNSWIDHNRKLIIRPESNWGVGEKYSVRVRGRNMMLVESYQKMDFKVEGYPQVKSFYPLDGEKDVVLDIEDPIKLSFDKSIEDFNLKFKVDPLEKMDYHLDEEDGMLKLIFSEGYKKGQNYDVEIYIKHKKESDQEFEKIYESSFRTKPPAPVNWSSDTETRLYQAKKFTEPKITEGKYIDINLKTQVMTIFESGRSLDAYLISSGKAGMDTPQGTFAIHNKFPRPWSSKYKLYMPYWMAIVSSGKFGIHELPEWPGGYKEGQNHLGIPVSHGCVRLGVGPAERVYNWADIGTPVVVHK